jgi:phosphomevalonate kinase
MVDVAASAPGKVLLAGGYLILQDGVRGLVCSSQARFHARFGFSTAGAALEAAGGASPRAVARCEAALMGIAAALDGAPAGSPRLGLLVVSPQFHEAWGFTLPALAAPFELAPAPPPLPHTPPPPNVFVVSAVEAALALACAMRGEGAVAAALRGGGGGGGEGAPPILRALLSADNDFYSPRAHLEAAGLPPTRASLAQLPPRHPVPLSGAGAGAAPRVAKTGLGSSAALVTCVVAAALRFLGCCSGSDGGDARALTHAAAQVAHCLAQGKVGSGFDVTAAVHGGCAYARLIPTAALEGAMGARARGWRAWGAALAALAAAHVAPPPPFRLPPGLSLLLADVAGGSETPVMVRGVTAWRDGRAGAGDDGWGAAEPAAAAAAAASAAASQGGEEDSAAAAAAAAAAGPSLWRALAASNARLAARAGALVRAAAADPAAHAAALAAFASASPPPQAAAPLLALAAALAASRALLAAMGRAAGVGVEPPEQARLADATAAVRGVVGAGVPGAGGADALFAVVVAGAEGAVEAAWAAYGRAGANVTPLLAGEGAACGEPGAGVAWE